MMSRKTSELDELREIAAAAEALRKAWNEAVSGYTTESDIWRVVDAIRDPMESLWNALESRTRPPSNAGAP